MSLKFLIVDDTHFMRKMLAEILIHNGYKVVGEASNGKEAIEQYENLHPDVVMMDINMPKMGGVEAIKEILKLDNNAVIFVCTAVNQQELINEALGAGAKGCVMKPFKPNQVIDILKKNSVKPRDTTPDDKKLVEESPVTENPIINYKIESTTTGMESTTMENSAASNQPRKDQNPRNFISSIMCHWQEEINGQPATFHVICTESENKVLIEMTSGGQEKHTVQFTLDGLRQLGGWLEEHVG